MNALLQGLDEPLAVGLGWALLHFLWQGAAVAIGLALSLAVMRRRSSQSRYVVCCTALAVMCLLPVATSVYCRPATKVQRSADNSLAATIVPVDLPQIASDLTASESLVRRDEAFPNDSAAGNETAAPSQGESTAAVVPAAELMQLWQARLRTLIPSCVTAWLSGVFILSLRLLVIWRRVQGMRCSGITPVSPDLLAMFSRLAARLQIVRPVQLLQSTLVEVPTVIGWLRPVILLPVASLAGLSAFQLEALLIHELAHIRRWDYFVNLLQNVVETLLFIIRRFGGCQEKSGRSARTVAMTWPQLCASIASGMPRRSFAWKSCGLNGAALSLPRAAAICSRAFAG
jgi:beta-lactamase regulating signal transducer with metallopeptidase domain